MGNPSGLRACILSPLPPISIASVMGAAAAPERLNLFGQLFRAITLRSLNRNANSICCWPKGLGIMDEVRQVDFAKSRFYLLM